MNFKIDYEDKVILLFNKLNYTFEFLCSFKHLGITSSFTKEEIEQRAKAFEENRIRYGLG